VARLSTLTQCIADTPGAARAFSVVSAMKPEEIARLSTMSQVIADTPGASRGTCFSVASRVMGKSLTLEEEKRLSSLSQVIADTPGAALVFENMAPEEIARFSTMSKLIADTPGAARASVMSEFIAAPPVSAGAPAAPMTPEATSRLSTLSQVIADTPGAADIFASLTPEEIVRLSTLSQLIADTPGATRATLNTIVSLGALNALTLQPLDQKDEVVRKESRKSASMAANAEQLRILAEMAAADEAARREREENLKSASDGVVAMQASLVAEHGEAPRQVPHAPNAAVLQRRLSDLSQAADDKEKKERDANRKSVLDLSTAQQADLVAEHGSAVRKVPSAPSPADLQKKRSQVGLGDD